MNARPDNTSDQSATDKSNAKGNARIDFLLDKGGKVFVNEINTLPGSIAFYLWEGIWLPER